MKSYTKKLILKIHAWPFHILKLWPHACMWGADCVCHKMSNQIGEVWNNGMTEWATGKSQMAALQCGEITNKELISPLWGCQKQREWCHVLLWQDTRRPATLARGLWSCGGIGGVRYRHRETGNTHRVSHTHMHSPGIPAVETERDLVHTAWVSHHQVKTRLET